MAGWMDKGDSLNAIESVSGLYISGRAAAIPEKLSKEGVTHVVQILKDEELSRTEQTLERTNQFQVKRIAIDDDGDEDILIHLDNVYDWIEEALHHGQTLDEDNDTAKSAATNRVLVHCRQGISRSGAFIVGYLMKKHDLSYSAALHLARQSRPIITPNSGFEKQLRIYQHCRYNIYLPTQSEVQQSTPGTVSGPGSEPFNTQRTTQPSRTPKAAYKVWKKERDARVAGGQNLGRFSSMATMAAEFGRRRLAAQQKAKEQRLDDGTNVTTESTKSNIQAISPEQQWQRVKDMEKAWNDKLVRGDVQRAKDTGTLGELTKEVFDSVKTEK